MLQQGVIYDCQDINLGVSSPLLSLSGSSFTGNILKLKIFISTHLEMIMRPTSIVFMTLSCCVNVIWTNPFVEEEEIESSCEMFFGNQVQCSLETKFTWKIYVVLPSYRLFCLRRISFFNPVLMVIVSLFLTLFISWLPDRKKAYFHHPLLVTTCFFQIGLWQVCSSIEE